MQDLYFIASKVVWFFLEPLHVLALLIALWAITRWLGSRVAGWLSVATLLWVVALGATPLWNSLLHQHETAIPLQQPDRIEGIIVLGGAFNEMVTEAHDQVSLNGASERMTATVQLMRQYPDAPVIFSGFSGRFIRGALSESDLALRFFQEMTGQTERVILENQSRNTYENALYTKDLMGFSGDGSWLLVTSAFHMPRAYEIFKDQGIPVIPYPTDYRSRLPSHEFRWNLGAGAEQVSLLLHEWVGLWVYRLTQKH